MYNDKNDCNMMNFDYTHTCNTDCENECFETEPMQNHINLNTDTHQACQPPNIFASSCQSQRLGMAYVPSQRWQTTFDYETGFMKGTIFPELYMPFHKEGDAHYG